MNNNQPELSTREIEILQLLTQGNRTSEIAKRLGLNFKSVAVASREIKTKLGAGTVTELAILLRRYYDQKSGR
ncbi:MAG: DNA-binding response regulator [Gammaproteobacteria bacterium]|nr:DNA-binding response regulator [Gammaproteobacteria bacterium]